MKTIYGELQKSSMSKFDENSVESVCLAESGVEILFSSFSSGPSAVPPPSV